MTDGALVAVDVGASSGRVLLGWADGDRLRLEEVYRFSNGPRATKGGLRWDAAGLRRHLVAGLKAAAGHGPVVGIGIDTWGVDYGLVDDDGELLDDPFAYRDERTARGVQQVHALVPADDLYRRIGLQFLPFNTLYQLAADGPDRLDRAATLLLMPDLVGSWLTGRRVAELTNASTTGLLSSHDDAWAWDVIDALGFPRRIFPELRTAGERLGPVGAEVVAATGLDASAEVILVGSHDTASAVVGVPAEGDRFAYISCGTWGLVGLELERPILSDESRRANFTNERGVDGTVRFLRNVMGLWLLQESMRTWAESGEPSSLDQLLAGAGELPRGGPTVDPNDPSFLPPGDMPARIRVACRTSGQAVPRTREALVRCILDSLAVAFAAGVREASTLARRDVDVVHVVGGGAQNELLCQLTADACGVTVVAGPVEATGIGNVAVQARARGWIDGDLASIRHRVRASFSLRIHEPGRARDAARVRP